jgi:hypothetical protein
MSSRIVASLLFCFALSQGLARSHATDKEPASTEIKEAEKTAEAPPETPHLVVGKTFPRFLTINPGGQSYALNDPWILKRFALLEFWSLEAGGRGPDQARMESLRNDFLAEDRLLILSICVDQDTVAWTEYVRAQKDLPQPNGSRVGFHTDRRWWQLELGADGQKDVPIVIEKFGLTKLPQFFLVRPGEILAAKHIPADRLKDVVTAELKKAAK